MVVERGPSPAEAQASRVKVLWPPAEEAFGLGLGRESGTLAEDDGNGGGGEDDGDGDDDDGDDDERIM